MNENARIRALIVDDEPLAREGVAMLLRRDPEVEIVGEAANGPEAVEKIESLSPDLVFLDVQIPEMDGFEVLRALDPADIPVVVFVTAYDKYALDAFRVHALDYLLKPYDDERFGEALERAKRHLKLSRVGALSQRLLTLLENGKLPADPSADAPRKDWLTRLAIKDVGRVVFLNVDEIDWIESADYYVQIHTGTRTYLHRQTMQTLEAELDPKKFLRIHRKAIVNCSRVKELRSYGRRDVMVVLNGGAELKVARSAREKLERLR